MVVVDDLLVLLVLRSELMLEPEGGVVVVLEPMPDVEGDDVDVSELTAPGPMLELVLEDEGLELIVELEGEDVLVSELILELEGLAVELELMAELEGWPAALGPPVVPVALLLDRSSAPIRVVALALVPPLEVVAELEVLSVLAEVPTPALEELLEVPGLLTDSATADVATHIVMMPASSNQMNILAFLIHIPPRCFL